MKTLIPDLRFAVRLLLKVPAFAVPAILTLALGIGANSAMFSVLNAVMLRPLPYKNADQLVKVWGKFDQEGIHENYVSEPEWWDLKSRVKAFSDVVAYTTENGVNVMGVSGDPLRATAGYAAVNLFNVLGVSPQLGRTFGDDEDKPGANRVAVLSNGLWRDRFGGDPGIVGKSITVDLTNDTVVGVLPASFDFGGDNQLWLPLALDPAKPKDRGSHYLEILGRRKPNVSTVHVSQELAQFAQGLARDYPSYYGTDTGWSMFAVPLKQEIVGDFPRAILILYGAVTFVLLIACVNIANLLMVRASVRHKEIAIRFALGAGRSRLVRQLLTESVMLALVAGVTGLLLANWGLELLRNFIPRTFPHVGEISLDRSVLFYTVLISVFTGVLFGLAPALRLVGANVPSGLQDGARSGLSLGGRRALRVLVIAEVSFALILLTGAGLMIKSFDQIMRVAPGFRTQSILTMRVTLPESKYPDGTPVTEFYSRLAGRIDALPGVTIAGNVSQLPLSNSNSSGTVTIKDSNATDIPLHPGNRYLSLETDRRTASPGYFEAMGIPVLEGREFSVQDDSGRPYVAIVDADFAKRLWPGRDPIGQSIAIDFQRDTAIPGFRWRTVVGVVAHVRHHGLTERGREQAYFPLAQTPNARTMFLAVRTSIDPRTIATPIRHAVQDLDPGLPIYSVKTMEDRVADSISEPRLNLILLSVFASIALILAAMGIYSVMNYTVQQRRREIGIRVAVGASTSNIITMVIREAALIVSVGVIVGIAGALFLTRLMQNLLFQVRPNDGNILMLVAIVLTVTTLASTSIPAYRASQVDPAEALRTQ